jgi:outer membrane protein TolC
MLPQGVKPALLRATAIVAALFLGGTAAAQNRPAAASRTAPAAPLPLRAAIAEFLARSPDLAGERLVPTIAAIERSLAAERLRPQVAMEALAGRQAYIGPGVTVGPVAAVDLPSGGTVRTGIALSPGSRGGDVQSFATVQIPLLRGAGPQVAQAQLRIATLQARIAGLAYDARASTTAALFAREFVALDTLNRRVSETEDALRRTREQLRAVQGLVDRGVLASGDALEIETAAIQRELEATEIAGEATRQRLLVLGLLGRDTTQPLRTVLPDALRWPVPTEAEVVAGALQRPEVQLRALRVDVAAENRMLAAEDLRWDLSIVGDFRLRSIDDSNAYFGDRRFGSTDLAYGLGLRISVPLTTQAAELRVARAQAELDRSRFELQSARETAEREVLQRRTVLRREIDRRAVAERLLAVSGQKFQLEQRRLELGRSSVLQFRLAEEEFVRARASLTNDSARVLAAWIDLLNASARFQLPP